MPDTIIEKREVPAWVEHIITNRGGLNPFGKPNFRVIWGGNRTYLVGGMFKNVVTYKDTGNEFEHLAPIELAIVTEVAEMRTLLRYHPFRWHLERWCGPELYGSPEEWYRNTWDSEAKLHVMGDYPTEGDYEHVFYLAECSHMKPEDTDWCMPCQVGMGEYIPLEENVHILERQIWALLKSQDVSKSAEMASLFMREHIKRNIRNKVVGERVRGAMRPKIATQPTSWQDGTRCSVPEAKMGRTLVLPRNKQGFSQSTEVMPNQKQKEIEEN
jgi:hypothetical protein